MKKIILLLAILVSFSCKEEQQKKDSMLVKLSGPVFGTGFNIQYADNENTDFSKEIDSLFNEVNNSLSTYIPDSDISKLNRNEISEVDHYFVEVFNTSKSIYEKTEGVFDPTIGNVVNAWNFGAETNKFLTDSTTIDSLMQFVGFNKIKLTNNIISKPPSTYLEFNAIAKGYGVDVIAEFLESKNMVNYLVEIGGEIRAKGKNIEKDSPWKVGLDEPRFDGEQSVFKAIELRDEAMATSGTYRKFKIDENGNKYAHIIDTKTGYPTKTNILSVSVIAADCMTADGYATAFQAMGIKRVEEFLKSHSELKAYVIYEGTDKTLKTLNLNNFPE
ncbi:thiamine biosynthesis protein [Winogradskyella sp. J14-2]|uniref:FAD:protein FMN transferase n=1 Tax=Winogradskyella sp. J14-2 TaxID=1936080 RepID=UPI000972B8AD|nr:FAD:protein FMN transferase [Winogradskyella sp. J14-2]APY07850.1 thiamine biosynthesis protein [Winogradskyella sp. J14-2]